MAVSVSELADEIGGVSLFTFTRRPLRQYQRIPPKAQPKATKERKRKGMEERWERKRKQNNTREQLMLEQKGKRAHCSLPDVSRN